MNKLRCHSKKIFKLASSEWGLDPFQAINRKRAFGNFSGFDLLLRIIIYAILLVLCQRLWDKLNPDFPKFQTVWQTFFLKPCYFGLNKFQNFQPFLWTGHFPPRHGITHYPSNINLFVLNPIKLPLKCRASF